MALDEVVTSRISYLVVCTSSMARIGYELPNPRSEHVFGPDLFVSSLECSIATLDDIRCQSLEGVKRD